MVQMYHTCLDDTLEILSIVEKNPHLYLPRSEHRMRYQSELRFFRMFLWCFPESDANLHADLNFVATSIAELYKLDAETCSFALNDTEYNHLLTKVIEKDRECQAEVVKVQYREHLISSSCSFEAECSTSNNNKTMVFLDAVLAIVNDLLERVPDEFLPEKSQLETLEELVYLLRNLVYYTHMDGSNRDEGSFGFRSLFLYCFSLCDFNADPETDLISRFSVHDCANKAACLSLLCWITGMQDESIRHLLTDLQKNVDPGNPEFIKLCFEFIKAPKMKCEDRLLFSEFVSRFVDFFLGNLMLILKDDVQTVREGLIYIVTFLADPPANTANHLELSCIQDKIYAVLDQASNTIYLYGQTNMDLAIEKRNLDDVLQSIDEVRGRIETLYVRIPPTSWSDFPRINALGYFECLLAYLENLKETMNKDRKLVPFLKHQIYTIQEELLKIHGIIKLQHEHDELKDIWEQITSLLYQADFAIKSSFFVDNAIWYNLTCISFVSRMIKDIRCKVMSIQFETHTEGSHVCGSSTDVLKPPTSTSIVEVVVGFEKEIELLIDRLTWGSEKLDIVSIVGMGGIGKTTLAKKLYSEPSVKNHFYKRAFCSVSQVYRKRNVLLDILSDISPIDDVIRKMSEDDLAQRLRKSLKGSRYLIVVDDIWNINVWDDLKHSFPDDRKGSRVIFTTRINAVSLIAKPDSTPCQLPFLSNDESWELLQLKVFHKDPCPPHLLDVGKLIAGKCKGLPLSIVVIAGLLARIERSLLQWNEVAVDLRSLASNAGCNDIIKLSYKHLPEALKSCFLYLGAFLDLEYKIISAKRLTLLWVAEGFVKSESSSLHKTAKKYLDDLGDMNLVTVFERSCNGRIRSCHVHDLIRDFCKAEAQAEHYMCYINEHNKNIPVSSVLYQYRISIEAEWRSFVDVKPTGPTVHSLLYFSDSTFTSSKAHVKVNSLQSFLCNFKLVHVLNLQEIEIDGEFPTVVTTLVHLRYLALRFSGSLYVPPDISNIWGLETLVLWAGPPPIGNLLKTPGKVIFPANPVTRGYPCEIRFPKDIWRLKRLRYVEALNMVFFALDDATGVFSLLPDLLTFKSLYIPPREDGDELLRRLSNVRKLSCMCRGWWDPDRECNELPKLEILTKLESLRMVYTGAVQPSFIFSFPSTIRKLTLQNFNLPWNELSSIIGMLPYLEVLMLCGDAFKGKIWGVEEDEEFPNIKTLTLSGLDIEEWNVASIDSFPSLEKVVVFACSSLIAIPLTLSEVVTLMSIQVVSCKKSVADSAIQIQNDQIDSGNPSFEVELFFIDL